MLWLTEKFLVRHNFVGETPRELPPNWYHIQKVLSGRRIQ